MEWYEVLNFTIPRTSDDNISNNFNRSVLTHCQELNIHSVNGRVNGDYTANYTYIIDNGARLIDYFLVEAYMFQFI